MENCSRDIVSSPEGVYFVSISPQYLFITIHLQNKCYIFLMCSTLQIFLHIWGKCACFESCVRLACGLASIYNLILFRIRYSARLLLGHYALVWMVGFRMAGFMLSGSGIRVFVLGNMGLGWGGWGKYKSMMGVW